MIKKFKCIACGKKFDADDKDSIVCPKCHSDNVTPVKPNFIKPIGIVLALILSVGAGMFITKQVKSTAVKQDESEHTGILDTLLVSESDTASIPTHIEIDPTLLKIIEIQNTTPIYDKSTKSYSFAVAAKNVPDGASVVYELCENYDSQNNIKKVLKTSDDGKFVGIPASKNESSSYFVVANVIDNDGKELTSRNREIGGFDLVVSVAKGLTKEDLQKMINQRDGALQGGNPKISNNVVFSVTNLIDGDREPESFQDIYNNFTFGGWTSVSVVKVEHDSDNRVSKVVLSVKR